jgi:hypothetical protein
MADKLAPPAISLKRMSSARAEAGECIACDPKATSPQLIAELCFRANFSFFLCPSHEAQLLQTLLANYLRRAGRGKPVPALWKEDSEEEEEKIEEMKWNAQADRFEPVGSFD